MAEDSKTILSKISNEIKSRLFWAGSSSPELTASEVDQVIDDIVVATHQAYRIAGSDQEKLIKHVKSGILNNNGKGTYHQIRRTMAVYEARNKIYLDEHEQLKKIENGQARRALFWRATTTFTVASIIFLFYWFADYMGIAMPLSRVAL